MAPFSSKVQENEEFFLSFDVVNIYHADLIYVPAAKQNNDP